MQQRGPARVGVQRVEGGKTDDGGQLVVLIGISAIQKLEGFVAITGQRVSDGDVRRQRIFANGEHEIGVALRVGRKVSFYRLVFGPRFQQFADRFRPAALHGVQLR